MGGPVCVAAPTEADPALESTALLSVEHARASVRVLLRVGERGVYLDQRVDLDHPH